MVIHAIASYNTSWMADQGHIFQYASEKHLYTNQINPKNREYFLNAISNALHFWKNVKYSSAIAFQEINDQDYIKKNNPYFEGGFQYIIKAFIDISKEDDLETSVLKVDTGKSKPCLLTIWKKSKLGTKIYEYGEDIIYEINGNQQIGRPILIVLTDKNYWLINLHSPNHSIDSLNRMSKLRHSINKIFQTAFSKFGKDITTFEPNKLMIMGDFNDAYSGINVNDKLTIFGYEYTFGNQKAPYSCCYNFNSSCDKSIYGILDNKQIDKFKDLLMYNTIEGDNLVINSKECAVVYNDYNPKRDMRTGIQSMARTLGKRGQLINYKFTGDYCLTYIRNNIIQPLNIYRSRNYLDGISHESDHEMVILIFDDGLKGGSYNRYYSRRKILHNKNSKFSIKR